MMETGKEYSLAELFSDNKKIIIPDLQRDYCWGTKDDLAKNFVTGLYDYYEKNQGKSDFGLKLGMFYGYEEEQTGHIQLHDGSAWADVRYSEKLTGHVQLCDGQQRLTTLFLLIGMINRYSDSQEAFRKYLISDEEMNDDKEPYLLYSIRESTLYFLSDLIINIFFSDKIDIEEIKDEAWYFKDYDLDPTIQNILAVLLQIDVVLSEKTNIEDFGNFILHNLTFLYYDLGGRKNGEETYVIINTTGEPLTATENLKPLLLSKIESEDERRKGSDTWEKWENFFWNNRLENDTADNGLKEFFRWIMLLSFKTDSDEFKEIQNSGKFTFDIAIPIEEIDSYFDIIKFIMDKKIIKKFEEYLAPEDSDNHTQITWFQVLPVIKFIKRWGQENIEDIKRIYHFFFNLAKSDNVRRTISDLLPEAITIIDEMKESDICALLDSNMKVSKTVLTDEEKLKLEIYRKYADDREKIQTAFWNAEDSKLWNGEIKTLLYWSCSKTLGVKNFSYKKFIEYTQKIDKLFALDDLDILRRTLLTFIDNDNYPRILHGYTNYTFCYDESDWKTIFSDNKDEVRQLLDLLNLNENIEQQLEKIMTHPDCSLKYNLDKVIKHEEILTYAKEKNFQWDDDAKDWLIIPSKKATKYANLSNYVLYLDLLKKGSLCNSKYGEKTDDSVFFFVNNIVWTLWFYEETDGNCCVVYSENNFVIDLYSEYCMHYKLNIRYNGKNENEKKLLESLAKEFNLKLGNDEEEKRYYSDVMDEMKIIAFLENILMTIKYVF